MKAPRTTVEYRVGVRTESCCGLPDCTAPAIWQVRTRLGHRRFSTGWYCTADLPADALDAVQRGGR